MSSNDTNGDNSDGVECPTCGDTFSTKAATSTHHLHAHGESLRPTVECDWCGSEFGRSPSQVGRSEHAFCSKECYTEHQNQNWIGENHPKWEGGKVEFECKWCGDTAEAWPAADAEFCTHECANEYQSENPYGKGENSARWKGGEQEYECDNCGGVAHRQPSTITGKIFCDQSCHAEYMSEHSVGKNNNAWKGGYEPYYGPNWLTQRQACLERDGQRCQACGGCEDDVLLVVHHIQPLRTFNGDYEAANELTNLVTLCRPCHKKWEGMYLRPTLVG